jgi:hypothetical protein
MLHYLQVIRHVAVTIRCVEISGFDGGYWGQAQNVLLGADRERPFAKKERAPAA